MKKIIFTVVSIAAACIGVATVSEIQGKGKRAVAENAKKEIEKNRNEDEVEAIAKYDEAQDALNKLKLAESIEAKEKVDEYKKSINFDARKEEANSLASKKVADFKESIAYDESKSQLKKEYDDILTGWKEDNNFQGRIDAEKAKIEEVEKVSQNQKFMTKFVNDGSDFSKESSEKLMETIKENKDKAIKSAKESIKDIEKEYEEFKKSAKKDYELKVKDIETKVNEVRDEAIKESSATIKEMQVDVNKKAKEIQDEIISKRTDEQKSLETDAAYYSELVKSVELKEEALLQGEIANATATDITAAYFKEAGWSKPSVVTLLALPFVPIIFVGYAYSKFLFKVVNKLG